MRGSIWISWALAAALTVALWGCGSNRDSDGIQAPSLQQQFGADAEGRVFVGAGTCIGCHEEISFSADLVQGFLQSRHVVHEDHISAQSPAECLLCHDPIGDGSTIAPLIDPADVPAEGLAAVTCENCHGAGGEHFGTGPLPNATPDFNVCGNCHRDLPLEQHDHQGDMTNNILTLFQTSAALDTGHAASFSGKATPGILAGTVDMAAICARCHSDEGFRELSALNTGFAEMNRELNNIGPFTNVNVAQCRTCHDPHLLKLRGGGPTPLDVDPDPAVFNFQTAYSAEFNLCTGCHQAFLVPNALNAPTFFDAASGTFRFELDPAIYQDEVDAAGAFIIDASADTEVHNPATGALLNPANVNDRTITDTHFRLTDAVGAALIQGYNINAADERPCTVCHDPHGSTKFLQATASTIASQWGASGHAAYTEEPFTHEFSSAVCMKCHSGTEYVKFVNGVEQADLSLSEGARVIACVACHDLQTQTLTGTFAPGPRRTVADVEFPSGDVVSLGGDNNLCAECHQGRAAGNIVADNIAAGDFGFVNRHYFAAAAIYLGSSVTAGFEYPGRTYMGRNEFLGHININKQLCVQCHLRGTADHNFLPALADCSACHFDSEGASQGTALTDFELLGLPFGQTNIDYDGDGANLPPALPTGLGESFQHEIDGMANLLLTQIQAYASTTLGAPIIYGAGSYPYWFNDNGAGANAGNGIADADEVNFGNSYQSFDASLLQAAFNYHSAQDPCGDIHNYKYVIQTLYDSVDDLNGGGQDDSAAVNFGIIRPTP